MNDNLYIIPHFDKHGKVIKTHLARASNGSIIEMLCLPNMYIWLHNCECPTKCTDGDCGTEATTDFAEHWDSYFNEVTCQTCLRIARWGYKRNIPNDAQKVLI